MNAALATAADIVNFWREAGPNRWFKKDAVFDDEICERYLATHEAAAAGKLTDWENAAQGALALLILLDQFPRNMFRGEPRVFASDQIARAIAAGALVRGFDSQVPNEMLGFFYLPFEHSENPADQQRAVAFYRTIGDADGLKWAELHADIIRRFGRFPHRNVVLRRASTPEEQAFLDGGGFSG